MTEKIRFRIRFEEGNFKILNDYIDRKCFDRNRWVERVVMEQIDKQNQFDRIKRR